MSPEQKKDLLRMKNMKVQDHLPDDLKIAIQTFIQQTIIIGENDLDYMPTEYMENLITAIAKYPEYNSFTLDVIETLKRNDIM